jgi:hypothetical protein
MVDLMTLIENPSQYNTGVSSSVDLCLLIVSPSSSVCCMVSSVGSCRLNMSQLSRCATNEMLNFLCSECVTACTNCCLVDGAGSCPIVTL